MSINSFKNCKLLKGDWGLEFSLEFQIILPIFMSGLGQSMCWNYIWCRISLLLFPLSGINELFSIILLVSLIFIRVVQRERFLARFMEAKTANQSSEISVFIFCQNYMIKMKRERREIWRRRLNQKRHLLFLWVFWYAYWVKDWRTCLPMWGLKPLDPVSFGNWTADWSRHHYGPMKFEILLW